MIQAEANISKQDFISNSFDISFCRFSNEIFATSHTLELFSGFLLIYLKTGYL